VRTPTLACAAILARCMVLAQTTDKALTFDAASVKPFIPPAGPYLRLAGGRGGPGSSDPGRIRYPMVSLKTLLMAAYDIKNFQVSGPSWLDTELFDVQATMPPWTTKEEFHTMLQNLLADRFGLKVHHETKELPTYSIVVAKSGPKIRESAEGTDPEEPRDPPPAPAPGSLKIGSDGFPLFPKPPAHSAGFDLLVMGDRIRVIAYHQTIHDLAEQLSSTLDRPVRDATGLEAKFDFTLTFSPEVSKGPADGAELETASDIFTALQIQLGLKLESKKGPIDLVVIDRVEKTPTSN
jgi:uncharacterized protein (TIGR03435 family)